MSALLYYVGFIYIESFYGEFGLSVSSTYTPFYYVIVYSVDVIKSLEWWYWLLGIIVLVLAYFINERAQKYQILLLIVLSVVLLITYGRGASITGTRHAKEFREGYGVNVIHLTFKHAKVDSLPIELIKYNNEGELWLLSATEDRYLVLYQPESNGTVLSYGKLYIIPKDEVIAANLEVRSAPK